MHTSAYDNESRQNPVLLKQNKPINKYIILLTGVIALLLVTIIGVYALGREGSILENYVSTMLKDCYVAPNQWGMYADAKCTAGFSHSAWYQCTDPNINKIITKDISSADCLYKKSDPGIVGGPSWAYKIMSQCAMADCSTKPILSFFRIISRIFNTLP